VDAGGLGPHGCQVRALHSRVASLFAKATLAICERAAEQGLATAQLALAQLYAARRAGPKDLVHAYMWFLIASEQITQAKNHINKSMTMEQLLEAEQSAAEWMRKSKKITPSSIENPPNVSTA